MWLLLRRAIDYLDTVPPFLLIVLAITTLRWKRRDFILYYLCSQFLFNGYANWLNELKLDNLYAYSLNFSWSHYILSLYFFDLYKTASWKKLIVGAVALFQFVSVFSIEPATAQITFDSVSFGLISLLITLLSLYYYASQLSGQPRENILNVSDFWYVNGIFTYYASNFFIFLTFNTLISKQYADLAIIWRVHNIVFLVMCIYFFIGLQCRRSAGIFKS